MTPISCKRLGLRRWFRMSLRTFLVLFTLVSIWLGLAINRAHKQRAAVEAIVEMGGKVCYDYQVRFDNQQGITSPILEGSKWTPVRPSPSLFRSLFGEDFISPVVHVSIKGGNLTNGDLIHLEGLPHLRTLFIWRATNVTGDALQHLGGLSELEDLSLGIQMTDDDLRHLYQLKSLRNLFLMGPETGTVRYWARKTRVFDASDYRTDVSVEGVQQLGGILTDCRISY